MIQFLVLAVLATVALPVMLGFLSQHGLASGSPLVLLVVGVLGLLWVTRGKKYMIGAALVLWLVWSFTYPMYQAANQAMARGAAAPGQILAAVVEGAKVAAERVLGKIGLPRLAMTAADVTQTVGEAADELKIGENICRSVGFVRNKFGEESVITYCAHLGTGVFSDLYAYGKAAKKGVLVPAYPFLESNPAKLNSDAYLQCLARTVVERTVPYQECTAYKNRQEWRLCMELALQVPHDDALQRASVAPEIVSCRTQFAR